MEQRYVICKLSAYDAVVTQEYLSWSPDLGERHWSANKDQALLFTASEIRPLQVGEYLRTAQDAPVRLGEKLTLEDLLLFWEHAQNVPIPITHKDPPIWTDAKRFEWMEQNLKIGGRS